MKLRGFTIVEILIVLTVMAILLTLSVVMFTGSQIRSRDNERKTDMENFALGLESGIVDSEGVAVSYGYPSTTALQTYIDNNDFSPLIPSIEPSSLRAPGANDSSDVSVVVATNAATAPESVEPTPTINTYVYQPLSLDVLCTSGTTCRSFNLYYRLEYDLSIQVIRSRSQ